MEKWPRGVLPCLPPNPGCALGACCFRESRVMTHLQALTSPHVPGDQLRETNWAVPASVFYTAAFPVSPLQASYRDR